MENHISARLSGVADAPPLTSLLDFRLQSVTSALPLKRAHYQLSILTRQVGLSNGSVGRYWTTLGEKQLAGTCLQRKALKMNNIAVEGDDHSLEVSSKGKITVNNVEDKSREGVLPSGLRKPRSYRPKSKDHKRLNPHKLVLQYIVPCMNSYGLCIVDNFLGNKIGERVLQEVRHIHQGGKMQDGELAGGNFGKNKSIRGDKIAWVEGTETGCENLGFLLTRMDKLITYADGKLGSYKIKGRHKVSSILLNQD